MPYRSVTSTVRACTTFESTCISACTVVHTAINCCVHVHAAHMCVTTCMHAQCIEVSNGGFEDLL